MDHIASNSLNLSIIRSSCFFIPLNFVWTFAFGQETWK